MSGVDVQVTFQRAWSRDEVSSATMALFLIERQFADELDMTSDDATSVKAVNDEVGVSWLFSFLSADKRKTYCLYEAEDPDAIREAARRIGLPADVVVAVSELRPEQFA